MSENSSNLGIHGKLEFQNFEFSWITIPVFLLFVPILYIPITTFVVYRIFTKLMNTIKNKYVNVSLFKVITISHFLNLLFFIADFLYIRIPITGAVTSWCANLKPNQYFVDFLIVTYHVQYMVMLMPLLVSLVRLVPVLRPRDHEKINPILLKCSIPFILLYPLFFTSAMFNSLGYCESAGYPLQFGAITFRVSYATNSGLRNKVGLLFNSLFWLVVCLTINVYLIVKLLWVKSSIGQHARSTMSHKSEISLTITSFSMTLSYVTNGMIVVFGMWFPTYYMFMVVLRPFMNDLDTCIVPWLFFLTHPVFKKKSSVAILIPNRAVVNS